MRDPRERRARLLTAGMSGTAVPGNRRSCCRCSAAMTARPASRSGSRHSRCRKNSSLRGMRSACRCRTIRRVPEAPAVRTRSAARSKPRSPPRLPRCSRSIAASLRHGTGRKRPAAPSSRRISVTLNFSSADETATLKLSHRYDLTTVILVTQVKEAALAARAKAKKEADDEIYAGCAIDREADDRRRRGQTGRAGGQPVGCAVARAGRTTPSRCRCRRAPRT